jgi:hypothetical protein
MAHKILGNLFYAQRGGPAWHGLGHVSPVDLHLTAVQAFDRTGGAVEMPIHEHIMVAFDPDTLSVIMDPRDPTTPLYGSGRHIFRYPTPEDPEVHDFGHVKDKYEGITNKQACEALDASGLTTRWPVETMGVLDQGRRFFVTLAAGEWSIKGDPMLQFVLAREGKDGQSSFNLCLTDVRVVCYNTEQMALNSATINFTIPHDRRLLRDISFYGNVIGQIERAQVRMRDMRTKLADVKFGGADALAVFRAAWPDPEAPQLVQNIEAHPDVVLTTEEQERLQEVKERWEYRVERQKAVRDEAVQLLGLRNEEIQPRDLAGTGHIVFNVVTEMANYRRAHTKGGKLVDSIMIGARQAEMTRAFVKAADIAGIDLAGVN